MAKQVKKKVKAPAAKPQAAKRPSPAQLAARKAAGLRLAQMRLAKARKSDMEADKAAFRTEAVKRKLIRTVRKFSGTAPQRQPSTISVLWF